MRDQRNAGGEEARVVGRARNILAEFRSEFAEHRRDVDADLFEDAARHHRHDAAAACGAGVIGAAPRRAREAARRAVGERRRRGQGIFHGFERRYDLVAQRFEPCSCLLFARLDFVGIHDARMS